MYEVHASAAGWKADSNFGDYVQMVEGEDQKLFVCLFDPQGSPDAAAFCAGRCRSVFEAALKKCKGDVTCTLEQTLHDLDQQFLSSRLPQTVPLFPFRAQSCLGESIEWLQWGDTVCKFEGEEMLGSQRRQCPLPHGHL